MIFHLSSSVLYIAPPPQSQKLLKNNRWSKNTKIYPLPITLNKQDFTSTPPPSICCPPRIDCSLRDDWEVTSGWDDGTWWIGAWVVWFQHRSIGGWIWNFLKQWAFFWGEGGGKVSCPMYRALCGARMTGQRISQTAIHRPSFSNKSICGLFFILCLKNTGFSCLVPLGVDDEMVINFPWSPKRRGLWWRDIRKGKQTGF